MWKYIKIAIVLVLAVTISIGVFNLAKSIVEGMGNTKEIVSEQVSQEETTTENRVEVVKEYDMSYKEMVHFWKQEGNEKVTGIDKAIRYSTMLLECKESPYKGKISDNYNAYETEKSYTVVYEIDGYGELEVMCSKIYSTPVCYIRDGQFSQEEKDFYAYIGNKWFRESSIGGGKYAMQ